MASDKEINTKYLKKHYERVGTFHTRYNLFGRHRWIPYNSKVYKEFYEGKRLFPGHREVLRDEVVLDFDTPIRKDRDECIYNLNERLLTNNVAFSLWKTGGKGVHYHILFEELGEMSAGNRSLMKHLLIRHYCWGLIDKARIDFQLCGKHLVRSEGGKHEKTVDSKTLLLANKEFELNKIPDKVWVKYEEHKVKEKEYVENVNPDFEGLPPCIKFILSNDFVSAKDGRKNALFVLANWYKSKGLAYKEIVTLINDWNHYTLHDYLNDIQINATVKSCKGMMGCRGRMNFLSMINKVSLCEGCELVKKKENEDENEERK